MMSVSAAEPRHPRRAAFVQDFAVLDRAYEAVADRLAADAPGLFTVALQAARLEGESLQVTVAPAGWPVVLAKSVELRVGPVRTYADHLIVGFTWRARRGDSLFPRMDADLDLAPFGPGRTEVVLRGSYEPPGGLLGAEADRLLCHRVAGSTARAFLRRVCAGLTETV